MHMLENQQQQNPSKINKENIVFHKTSLNMYTFYYIHSKPLKQ